MTEDLLTRNVYHVIMAGGSGTRFWPASRESRPKQFLTLAGETALLRQAWERAAAMSGAERVYVAAGPGHREATLSMLPGLGRSRYLEEPVARNTAGCAGLAALHLIRRDPDAILVMSPADHVYGRPDALVEAIARAVRKARSGAALVTLGIRPTRPETGYGYIERGEVAPGVAEGIYRAARFVEKPDEAKAREYLATGRYFWNSGVFIWKAAAILAALESCAPDLWTHFEAIGASIGTADEARVTQEEFAALRSVSIDYAVLEKALQVFVVPADPEWSDVGSWDAAAELQDATPGSNVAAAGVSDLVAVDSKDCYVRLDAGHPRAVALVGVTDLLVIDSGDALLICRKGRSQSVREVVAALRGRKRDDLV